MSQPKTCSFFEHIQLSTKMFFSLFSNSTFLQMPALAWPEAEALAAWFWVHLSLANLRQTFYLILPSETSFGEIKDVPDYNLEVSAWWSMLILLEFGALWVSGHHTERVALNDTVASLSAGLLSQLLRLFVSNNLHYSLNSRSGGRTISLVAYRWIWENLRILELDCQSLAVWMLCLLCQDLAYYLGHRAMHEVSLLWAFHAIHHSSQYLNLSTALRQPLLQDLGLAPYELLQAFFIPPPLFLVHRYFSHIFQFWLHTSLLGSLGPLGWLLNTPAYHRVHHGRNPYCLDRNFGALLIVWDRLFGTFQDEKPQEPPEYGLVAQEDSHSFEQWKMQLMPLKSAIWDKLDLHQKQDESAGWHAKMQALYWPPGWRQGIKTKQFFHWRTLVNPAEGICQKFLSPVKRHNPRLQAALKAYLLIHFFLLICMFLHFQYDRPQLGWPEFSLKMAFFLASIHAIGLFFERKKCADLVEICRCLGFCLFQIHQNCHVGMHFSTVVLPLFFAICATFWTFRRLKKMILYNCWRCGRAKISKRQP